MGEILEFRPKKTEEPEKPARMAPVSKLPIKEPQRKPEKKETKPLRLTGRGKLVKSLAAAALFGATAYGISESTPRIIESSVSAMTHGVDKFEQSIDDLKRDAVISSYITDSGRAIDPYFREFPDPDRSGPSGKIGIDQLIKDGYNLKNFVVELVYGRPYPVASIPQTDDQIEKARQIASNWHLKGSMQNYWDFRDRNAEYAVWGKTTLKNPAGQTRTLYTSLNFLKPVKK